jgi:hypothetical protein
VYTCSYNSGLSYHDSASEEDTQNTYHTTFIQKLQSDVRTPFKIAMLLQEEICEKYLSKGMLKDKGCWSSGKEQENYPPLASLAPSL